eukprot:TRINITY_DN14184_c0_g1_i6.p1 TRINITY_DN14184_c0_g1~~TRINITY_DN14184_c0_g1_i6.p1  ORF type:complete len:112 (+),score=31.03 TRINITY_DN14184_c0_g1_i6:104-439(+)
MTAAAAAVKVKEVLLRCSFNESDPIVRCAHLLLTPCLEDEASKVEVEHVQAELIEELPEEEAEEAPEHMAMMYSPRPGHELGGYQDICDLSCRRTVLTGKCTRRQYLRGRI